MIWIKSTKIIFRLAGRQQVRKNFLRENNPEGIHRCFINQMVPFGAIYSAVAELTMKYISDLKTRKRRRRKRQNVDAAFRVLSMIRLESNRKRKNLQHVKSV